jgi:hypothetical protein
MREDNLFIMLRSSVLLMDNLFGRITNLLTDVKSVIFLLYELLKGELFTHHVVASAAEICYQKWKHNFLSYIC